MRNLMCGGALAALVCCHPFSANAYEAIVVSAETGQPLAGVWVMGQWQTGGGFVHGSGGCMLDVTRTDANGKFVLEGRDGFLGKWFPIRAMPNVHVFRPGFRDISIPRSTPSGDVFELPRDDETADARLEQLGLMMAHTDCGTDYGTRHKEMLRPLYEAVMQEASAKATTASQMRKLEVIRQFPERIETRSLPN